MMIRMNKTCLTVYKSHKKNILKLCSIQVSKDCKLWLCDSEQHEQFQDPETEKAKWNSASICFSSYTCAILTHICLVVRH